MMFNALLLRVKIMESGMTQKEFCKKTGITQPTLYRRMKSGVFRTDEIEKISSVLNLDSPEQIFLCKN